jgi:hypothetical protein
MSSIIRFDSNASVGIANGETTSAAIDFRQYAFGGIKMPGTITSTTLKYTVAEKSDGTFVDLYDSTNTLINPTIAASRAYPLPDELAGWPYFKIVLGSAEGAARVLTFVAKG